MDIQISAIVCTYNRDKYIYNTLQHIADNNFPIDKYEIILINNNSTDQTETECKRFETNFPDLNFRYYIENQQGLSFARNRGIQEARGNILVFLDDDAFIQRNYLLNLSCHMNTYPDAAAFGGKITPYYETEKAPEWMSKWTYSWVSAIDKGKQICLFKGNSYPIGANMGFRKNIFSQIGNFNTELGRNKGNLMGGEEKDIFNRLKARKQNIYYFPDLEVQHVIPEQRTTQSYIKKFAWGIGKSEQMRTLKISRIAYTKRLFLEIVKWTASFLLWINYLCKLSPQKGYILLYFRWYVTKGLLNINTI